MDRTHSPPGDDARASTTPDGASLAVVSSRPRSQFRLLLRTPGRSTERRARAGAGAGVGAGARAQGSEKEEQRESCNCSKSGAQSSAVEVGHYGRVGGGARNGSQHGQRQSKSFSVADAAAQWKRKGDRRCGFEARQPLWNSSTQGWQCEHQWCCKRPDGAAHAGGCWYLSRLVNRAGAGQPESFFE